MNILDRWDRTIFIRSPFTIQRSFPGASREALEEEMVGICAINALAMRLVVGTGFQRRFLGRRCVRGVWAWLQRPQPLRILSDLYRPKKERREFIITVADVHHRDQLAQAHGYDHHSQMEKHVCHVRCPWCILVYRREATTALAIASHLMRLQAVEHSRCKRQRQMIAALPPRTARAIVTSLLDMKVRRILSKIRNGLPP